MMLAMPQPLHLARELRRGDLPIILLTEYIAWWTPLYWLAWVLHFSAWPIGWVWLVGCVVITWLEVRYERGATLEDHREAKRAAAEVDEEAEAHRAEVAEEAAWAHTGHDQELREPGRDSGAAADDHAGSESRPGTHPVYGPRDHHEADDARDHWDDQDRPDQDGDDDWDDDWDDEDWDGDEEGEAPAEPDDRPAWMRQGQRAGVVLAILGMVGVLVSVPLWPGSGLVELWGSTVVGLTGAGLATLLRPGHSLQRSAIARIPGGDRTMAAALALLVGVFSLFIRLPDSDDTYYVNRSQWIAEHGSILVKDTLFSPGVFVSPYNGGLPIDSIEALIGSMSHLTGIAVGTLTWIWCTFIAATLTVWAFWLLARRWAPRRPLVVLGVAVLFMLFSGQSRLGNFWIARIWQGKVIALVILVPLVWAWADDLVRTDRRRPLVLLAVAGLAFIGLTSTAAILAPLMAGGMILTALLLRTPRLALGGLLFAACPVLAGVVVAALSSSVGNRHDGGLQSAAGTFLRVLGPDHFMVAVALIALVAAPLVVRSVPGALMIAATMGAGLIMLVPQLLQLANALTGAGPILWRVLYMVPLGLLVGFLSVVQLRRRPTWNPFLGVALPVVLGLGPIFLGASLWTTADHGGPVSLSSSPTWKVDKIADANIQAVMATHPHGVILLPPKAMTTLPTLTTSVFAVDPRIWYAHVLQQPRRLDELRIALTHLAQSHDKIPDQATTTAGLRELKVTLACVKSGPNEQRAINLIKGAGFGGERHLSKLVCLWPPKG